ncbi:transcriptional regulator, IclR family (plasmid) [halophilic archaeon DL31]|nr:transcriptional regulator, IclR family [halophilic archaeon DL31]
MSDVQAPSDDMVKAAETLFDIVESLEREDGKTVTAIADDLGYAKSTVHRHLTTLTERGYVVKEANQYHVGLRFLALGERARNRDDAYQLAREKVEELATDTKERAQFIVEEHGDAVYIHRALGDHAVRTDPGIGKRIPLHATSAGKAILANLPEDRLFDIIEQTEFSAMTDSTITSVDRLLEELEDIQERGYSFNRQENIEGLHAIGVPITNGQGEILGALSVSGPSHRLKGDWFEEELPDLLLGAANELELNIAYS